MDATAFSNSDGKLILQFHIGLSMLVRAQFRGEAGQRPPDNAFRRRHRRSIIDYPDI